MPYHCDKQCKKNWTNVKNQNIGSHTQCMGLEYDVRGMRIELWTQNGKIELQAANYRVIMGSVWDFQHLYRYHMHKHKQTHTCLYSTCLQMLTVVVEIVQFASEHKSHWLITINARMHILCSWTDTPRRKRELASILFLYVYEYGSSLCAHSAQYLWLTITNKLTTRLEEDRQGK